jgi:hypothetical protein
MIARLQEENKSAKGMGAVVSKFSEQLSDPAVIMGLISGLTQMFGRQAPAEARPINGMGSSAIQGTGGVIVENGAGVVESLGAIETETETEINMEAKPKDPKIQAIENAVRELIKSDPDFHLNIAKLAQISQCNPTVYKMAVQYLKTL